MIHSTAKKDLPNNIVLIGPMGAGKTSIGKQLALALNREFIDTDEAIKARTGVDIPTIFDYEGEAGFRTRETTIIKELMQANQLVLATGGGSILNPDNRHYLKDNGFIIYLQTSIEQQLHRTQYDRNRPLLQTENPAKKLKQLLEEREPIYMEMADISFVTDNHTVQSIVNTILTSLETQYLTAGTTKS